MCFSATASFAASVAIGAVTAVAFRQARTGGSYLVACIPLFFAVQQALEGLLWLALRHPPYHQWQTLATYGFLLFAQVIWPVMIPLMVWALEPQGTKKKVLSLFLVPGCSIGLYFLWCLAAYSVTPVILGQHIRYELHFPGYRDAWGVSLYLIATIIPPVISGHGPVRLFGWVLLVSMAATAYFYKGHLISVWCFFAALLSIITLLIIRHLNQEPQKDGRLFSGSLPRTSHRNS